MSEASDFVGISNEGIPPVRLADDFFLIAHDDTTGRPRLHPRALALGLAAALLGELMLAGRIGLRSGRVAVVDHTPPDDSLAHATVEQLLAEDRRHGVRTWLAYLGREAVDGVGARLARAGHLVRTERRRLRGRTVRYTPVAMNTAAWPAVRLHRLLSRGEQMSWQDALLAGLVEATGLTGHVLWDTPAEAHERLDTVRAALARHYPAAAELLAETHAAVGDAVLTHRR